MDSLELAIIGLLVGLCALAGWLAARNARAIGRAALALGALASGRGEVDLEGAGRSGGAGDLARAFAGLRTSLSEKREAESLAEVDRRDVEEQRSRQEADARQAAAEQDRIVGVLAAGLEGLARGRLTTRIEEAFPGPHDRLREDFNSAAGQLDRSLSLVRDNADGIRASVGEISAAYKDLARQIARQAENVEQSASTMQQISDAVRSSARATAQASEAVVAAKVEAERSDAVVNSTVAAMNEIVGSTQEIDQVVEVIDSIAFQTNLLALNAGVEAARAGEAGRGFAVVATEVRALAQHTAERAKDIKELIATSKGHVDTGKEHVNNTGDTLRRIVVQVGDLAEFVGQIAEATQEQAGRLGAVNLSTGKIDAASRHNTNMAETCTEAVRLLQERANELSETVGRFTLSREEVPDEVEPADEVEVAVPTPHAKPQKLAHILIVDDNATNRMVAASVCEVFDCTSEQANDGVAAVAAARSGRFDVILMDIMMPVMDGKEATLAIRRLPGEAGRVPIIALTANALEENVKAYLAVGMNSVVEKPISPQSLFDAIRAALGLAGRRTSSRIAA